MPHPDNAGPMESPPPIEEELSATERHWNQLAVGVVTVATAVMAAVLFIAGLDSGRQDKWNDWDTAGALFAGFAFFLYLATAVFMTRVLFPPGNTRALRLKNKRGQISNLLSTFSALVITAGMVIFTAIMPSAVDWLRSDQSTQQSTGDRTPVDGSNFDYLTRNGSAYRLAHHLDHTQTTIISGERYLVAEPGTPVGDRVYPDLLVAFNADPQAYRDSNAYIITEQGKPPDFVLEIAPTVTADNDTGHKRLWYAGLGVPEYWRVDEASNDHGAKLAGDRLVEGRYEAVAIEEPADDVLQGYSKVLDLHVRWERGQLEWRDPATEEPITSLEAAERQIQELQEELRWLRGE